MSTLSSNKELLAALSQFGYPTLEPNTWFDPNHILTQLVKTDDVRLMEGFPVVLANVLSQSESKVDLRQVEKQLYTVRHKKLFGTLIILSQSLFKLYGLNLEMPSYKSNYEKQQRNNLTKALTENGPIKVGSLTLEPLRFKTTFLNYVVNTRKETVAKEKVKVQEEFRHEYYLSLLLSPRQKDLLQKKLRRESMNKTEREYFSRVVKKKLIALADPDIQRLAQKALQ